MKTYDQWLRDNGFNSYRKLKAVWSMEAAQDLKTFLDIEKELTAILAKEMLNQSILP